MGNGIVEGDMKNMQDVFLERLRFGILSKMPKDLLDVDVDIVKDTFTDDVIAQVKGFVWAEQKSIQHQEIVYPIDWREAFKERWFTEWMKKRWPVRYKRVVLDVKAIYPTFRPAVPKEQCVLHIQRYEKNKWETG